MWLWETVFPVAPVAGTQAPVASVPALRAVGGERRGGEGAGEGSVLPLRGQGAHRAGALGTLQPQEVVEQLVVSAGPDPGHLMTSLFRPLELPLLGGPAALPRPHHCPSVLGPVTALSSAYCERSTGPRVMSVKDGPLPAGGTLLFVD